MLIDKIIPFYQEYFGLQNALFSRIHHEDAMIAIVYKITQPIDQPLFLKICERPSDYEREVYFLNHFSGKLPVPHILKVVRPQTGIHGAILMEYLPGNLLKVADCTDELAYALGSLLAHIHLNRVKGYGDLTQAYDLSPDPRIYFSLKFEENFAECSPHIPESLLTTCHHYFDQHIDLLSSVDGPCMIHRDFRPGNVIVHEGTLQGIIDWASGRASFAEEDFCSLEHEEWMTDPSRKKSFLAGYANIRPIPDYSDMMPLLRLNKALAIIGFTVKSGTWSNKHAKVYQFNRKFIEKLFKN